MYKNFFLHLLIFPYIFSTSENYVCLNDLESKLFEINKPNVFY
jgi:hypothetical protein